MYIYIYYVVKIWITQWYLTIVTVLKPKLRLPSVLFEHRLTKLISAIVTIEQIAKTASVSFSPRFDFVQILE